MKKYLIILVFPLLLVSCKENEVMTSNQETEQTNYTVRYLANIPKESVSLSSNREAVGENLLFYTEQVKKGEKITKIEETPKRVDYIFAGWFEDSAATIAYDFTKEVNANLNLYAGWTRDIQSTEVKYQEPKLSFVEKIDDSVEGLNLETVCNFPISENAVGLPSLGIAKLLANKDDVKELLGYSINSNTSITSAKYVDGNIEIAYQEASIAKQLSVEVNDDTNKYVVNNKNYENKALNYEKVVDYAPYNIVLGGSSSMENWKNSAEDMQPLTTINVGIGGTTVEQWTNSLAPRLIYPYNPREVVLYVGINNVINSGNTGQETGNKLVELFSAIHDHLPETHIYYIYMNLIPGYMRFKDEIETGNRIAKEFGDDKDYLSFIDAGSSLLKQDGNPNSCYFLTDGLHMSLYGYTVWGQVVKNFVIEKEKELYK